jgi:hypothetical protein
MVIPALAVASFAYLMGFKNFRFVAGHFNNEQKRA